VVKKVALAKATSSLAECVRTLNGDVLVLTESGRPVAALVPIEGIDLESLEVGTNPGFIDIIERSRRRYQEQGGLSLEEMQNRLNLPAKPKVKSRNGSPKTGRKPSKQPASPK
jgi:antitoxin (DNA-binding transcriptional repressor) of toxin-antitoxin stability system